MDFTPLASKILRETRSGPTDGPNAGGSPDSAVARAVVAGGPYRNRPAIWLCRTGEAKGSAERICLEGPYGRLRGYPRRCHADGSRRTRRALARSLPEFRPIVGDIRGQVQSIFPSPTKNLRRCHYYGASYKGVSHYLRHNPESRLFSGKA